MGYNIQQGDSRFCILQSSFPVALAALNSLAARARQEDGGKFRFVETHIIQKATTIDAHLKEWGCSAKHDRHGNIVQLNVDGEKLGDEEKLMQALAPAVLAGSFIVMHGEDGDCWRWYFDGAQCHTQEAQVGFGPEPGDIVDVQAREVRTSSNRLPGTPKRLGR